MRLNKRVFKKLLYVNLLFSICLSNCKKDRDLIANISTDKSSSAISDSTDRSEEQDSELNNADTIVIDSIIPKEEAVLTPSPEESITDEDPIKDSLSVNLPGLHDHDDYYNITSSLPSNYVVDGSVDYTSYIQNAINKYSKIVFPGFPILVNDEGLDIPSNRTIIFREGSQLRLKPSTKGSYSVLNIKNVANVTLTNPYIVGDRYKHLGTSGEWGMGISIYGAEDITINEAKIYDCWGDGIYIGKGKGTNKNILLNKPFCKSNRRDGISIIDADGLKIISPYAGFSDGTAPFCGINIEPNDYTNEIKNIEIINPTTEGNKGNGVQAGFGRLYGKVNKNVSVAILNHVDRGSGTAMKSSCRTTLRKGNEIIYGTFTIVGSDWQKNEIQPLSLYSPELNFKYNISKPKVMSLSGSYLKNADAEILLAGRKSIWKPTVYSLTF